MAGDPFRSVTSGEPLRISAEAWNRMLSLARSANVGGRGGAGFDYLNRNSGSLFATAIKISEGHEEGNAQVVPSFHSFSLEEDDVMKGGVSSSSGLGQRLSVTKNDYLPVALFGREFPLCESADQTSFLLSSYSTNIGVTYQPMSLISEYAGGDSIPVQVSGVAPAIVNIVRTNDTTAVLQRASALIDDPYVPVSTPFGGIPILWKQSLSTHYEGANTGKMFCLLGLGMRGPQTIPAIITESIYSDYGGIWSYRWRSLQAGFTKLEADVRASLTENEMFLRMPSSFDYDQDAEALNLHAYNLQELVTFEAPGGASTELVDNCGVFDVAKAPIPVGTYVDIRVMPAFEVVGEEDTAPNQPWFYAFDKPLNVSVCRVREDEVGS